MNYDWSLVAEYESNIFVTVWVHWLSHTQCEGSAIVSIPAFMIEILCLNCDRGQIFEWKNASSAVLRNQCERKRPTSANRHQDSTKMERKRKINKQRRAPRPRGMLNGLISFIRTPDKSLIRFWHFKCASLWHRPRLATHWMIFSWFSILSFRAIDSRRLGAFCVCRAIDCSLSLTLWWFAVNMHINQSPSLLNSLFFQFNFNCWGQWILHFRFFSGEISFNCYAYPSYAILTIKNIGKCLNRYYCRFNQMRYRSAPRLANRSAHSLPKMPEWAGTYSHFNWMW